MAEQQLKTCSKTVKNLENRRTTSSKKQSREGENPARYTLTTDHSPNFERSRKEVCKNSACRAVFSEDDKFCRRCSCCICKKFDGNKDPSLWVVCESETAPDDSCGLSCHIECAFTHAKLGVVNLGQYMKLDGNYCCDNCGKVVGIVGCWKKQVAKAKHARRVDFLCHRIFLSYRLFEGTRRFRELHEIMNEAKAKLEAEVGPLNGQSVKMARGIVSRLDVAADVQKLCSTAEAKADEWLTVLHSSATDCTVDSLPAACSVLFEEVTSSSLVVVLRDIPSLENDSIEGYKFWYCQGREETFSIEPSFIFPRQKRRISLLKLQPSTEYTFRIISYAKVGALGRSEAKCFTKSFEILDKNPSLPGDRKDDSAIERSSSSRMGQINSDLAGSSSGCRDFSKMLEEAFAQGQGRGEEFCSVDENQGCGVAECESPEDHKSSLIPLKLDLNVPVPDLNDEPTSPLESLRDDDNGYTPEQADVNDVDAASHVIEKAGLARSNGSGSCDGLVRSNGDGPCEDSQTHNGNICTGNSLPENPHKSLSSANEEAHDICTANSLPENRGKRVASANEEAHDSDTIMSKGSPVWLSSGPGSLGEHFEYCVKAIRDLECNGHITPEFRLKFLTWFSLRSMEQERRIVRTFIHTLLDNPEILAAQLADAFGEVVSSKKPRSSDTGAP